MHLYLKSNERGEKDQQILLSLEHVRKKVRKFERERVRESDLQGISFIDDQHLVND